MQQEEAHFNFKLQLYKLLYILFIIEIEGCSVLIGYWLVDVLSHDSSKSINFCNKWAVDYGFRFKLPHRRLLQPLWFFKFPAESHTLPQSSSTFIYLFAV